jgi:hypothetical protein
MQGPAESKAQSRTALAETANSAAASAPDRLRQAVEPLILQP